MQVGVVEARLARVEGEGDALYLARVARPLEPGDRGHVAQQHALAPQVHLVRVRVRVRVRVSIRVRVRTGVRDRAKDEGSM